MLRGISIKGKLIILSLLTIIVVAVVVGVNSIISINNLSKENVANFEKEAYAKKEAELKNYVSLAMKTVDSFYQRTSKEKVKVEVQSYLKGQAEFLFSILEGEYKKYNGKIPTNELKQK